MFLFQNHKLAAKFVAGFFFFFGKREIFSMMWYYALGWSGGA